MTHRAGAAGSGINRGWMVPIGLGAVILVLAGANVLSRSLIVDFLAWWPVWLGIGVLHLLIRNRRFGLIRGAGIAPLLATPALIFFLVAHILGWAIMPSSSLYLIGPDSGELESAALVADIDGVLRVGVGSSFLYEVDPIRRGGAVAIPEALEEVQGTAVTVDLRPAESAGLKTFAGWRVALDADLPWDLELRGNVTADLTQVGVSSLVVSGRGEISLGGADVLTPASVTGDFDIVVPAGAPVVVLGTATVPDGWEKTDDGWVSGGAGEGWVITVSHGSDVSVSER